MYDIRVSENNPKILYAYQSAYQSGTLQATTPVKREEGIQSLIEPYGEDNLLPQNIYNAVKDNTIVPSTLDKKMRLLVAGGWVVLKVIGYDNDGNELYKYEPTPQIDKFLKRINLNSYLVETTINLYYYYIAFTQIILDRQTDQIVGIRNIDTNHCRFARQNANGEIPYTYVNANWDCEDANGEHTKVFHNLDTYGDTIEDLRTYKNKKAVINEKLAVNDTHYIYPLKIHTPATIYYPTPPHLAAIKSKWIGLANAIAAYKKTLMENELSASYIILTDEEYWVKKYANWHKLGEKEKDELIKKHQTTIDKLLAGAANAGKTISLPTVFDRHMKIERQFVKIIPLDRNIREGAYIEDSLEASSHILYALGVPATLIGNTPSKGGMGSGSGSDVYEHFRLYSFTSRLDENIILEPFHNLIFPYMGWQDYRIVLKKPNFEKKAETTPSKR
jgi:hypothetical protein